MIESIRIQNFKSIQDVTVELSAVTVLVGRSGTGKSNFVHAIRFLRDTLTIGPNATSSEWPSILPIPKSSDSTRFELSFSVDGIEEKFQYTLEFYPSGPTHPPAAESLSLGGNVLFLQQSNARGQATWVKEPALVDVPRPGSIALGRMPSLAEVVIAYSALSEGIGCYAFPNSLMLDGRQNEPVRSGFSDSGENYLATMKTIVSNLQDLSVRKKIVAALQRVNQGVSSVELNELHKPTHAIVGHQFGDRTLGLRLSQESEGFRRFFAHLLALYQRPPKLLMLFEHPEDGIHPGALALLADEFQATPGEGRGQVVLTTHNPGLLDRFTADQIRVVEMSGFYSQIGPLADEQKESVNEHLIEAGELLTVDPARLQSDGMETAPG